MPHTIEVNLRTVSARPLPDYEVYLNENYTDGEQVENKGTGAGDLSGYRQVTSCDGLDDYVDTGHVIGPNDAIEYVFSLNDLTLSFLFGAYSLVTSPDGDRFYFGVYSETQIGFGYKDSTWTENLASFSLNTGTIYTAVASAGGKLWMDGALILDKSTEPDGTLPTGSIYVGAAHAGATASYHSNSHSYRTRIATYTDVSNATGDLDADLAAGLCTVVHDWRMRGNDFDVIVDDMGVSDISGAAIVGADPNYYAHSTHDALDETPVLRLENPKGTVYQPLVNYESVTFAARIKIGTGYAIYNNSAACGYSSGNSGGRACGLVIVNGGIRAYAPNYVNSLQSYTFPTDLDNWHNYAVVIDKETTTFRCYLDGVEVHNTALTGEGDPDTERPYYFDVASHAIGTGLAYANISDPTYTVTSGLHVPNWTIEKAAWSAEKAINWTKGGY